MPSRAYINLTHMGLRALDLRSFSFRGTFYLPFVPLGLYIVCAATHVTMLLQSHTIKNVRLRTKCMHRRHITRPQVKYYCIRYPISRTDNLDISGGVRMGEKTDPNRQRSGPDWFVSTALSPGRQNIDERGEKEQ